MDLATLIDERQFQSIGEVQSMIRQLRLVEQDMKKRRGSPTETEGQDAQEPIEDSRTPPRRSQNLMDFSFQSNSLQCEPQTELDTFEQIELLDIDKIPTLPDDCWLIDMSASEGGDNILDIFDDSYMDTGLRNKRYALLYKVKGAINEHKTNAILASSTKLKRNASYVIRRDSELAAPVLPIYSSPKRSPVLAAVFNDVKDEIVFGGNGFHDSPSTEVVPMEMSNPDTPLSGRSSFSPGTRPQNLNATITKGYSPKALGYVPSLNLTSYPNSPELNTTFTHGPPNSNNQEEVLSTSSNSNNSVYNISMEEIHSMARIQEQSLVNSTSHTLSRKDTRVIDYASNGEKLPSPSRTWSADTYSLDQSNPPSDHSSGVSSPRDSYENVQMGVDVRRSMPNLAIVKELTAARKQSLMQIVPGKSQLRRQPYHISDSKLPRPQTKGLSRPAVKPLGKEEVNVPKRTLTAPLSFKR